MPYKEEWVDPEVFLEHKGITIYHIYKNDNIDQGERTYHYTTDIEEGERGDSAFDVRDLDNWTEPNHPPFLSGAGDTPENRAAWAKYHKEEGDITHIRAIVIEAIDKGFIQPKTEEE